MSCAVTQSSNSHVYAEASIAGDIPPASVRMSRRNSHTMPSKTDALPLRNNAASILLASSWHANRAAPPYLSYVAEAA